MTISRRAAYRGPFIVVRAIRGGARSTAIESVSIEKAAIERERENERKGGRERE